MKHGLLLIVFIMMFVGGCSLNEFEYSDDIYLIPDGYEGSIIVFYGIPDEPVLEQQGDSSIFSVKEEFLESMSRSELPTYGITLTSTPYVYESGTISNDKFFYIDSDGGRTSIQEDCIHQGGGGAITKEDGKDVVFQYLQVTMSGCGQDFWFDGKDNYYDQLKEVTDYWFNELY